MAKAGRKKRRNVLLMIPVIIFLGYAIVSLIMSQVAIQRQKQEYASLCEQIEQKKVDLQELDYILNSGGDKEYIEKMAREKLGYISPNEKVFIDISGR